MGELKLLERQVDIWILFEADAQSPTWFAHCRSVLSEAELDRAARFVFPQHRRMFVLAHGFTRSVLSRYMCLPPQEWEFSVSPHGKPSIANAGAASVLAFNVSHTSHAVAVAVARPMQLGVDIEQVRSDIECEALARHFFSAREVQDILAAAPADRPGTFARIWTFKEAYIKARGEGLQLPLDQFAFSYRAPDAIGFSAAPALDAAPACWKVSHTQLPHRHVLSLCAGRDVVQSTTRVLRCTVAEHLSAGEAILNVQETHTLPLPWVTVWPDE